MSAKGLLGVVLAPSSSRNILGKLEYFSNLRSILGDEEEDEGVVGRCVGGLLQ